MQAERTPLVAAVRVQRTPRYRSFPHSTFRRFCTIALSCVLIIFLVLFLFTSVILPSECSDHDHWHHAHRHHDCSEDRSPFKPRPHTQAFLQSEGLTFDDLKDIILETPSEEKVRAASQYYTSGPHLAGKNLSEALWTRDQWQEAGVKSDIVAYDVYINYPVSHRLALLDVKNGKQKVKFECSLKEDVLEDDPTTNLTTSIPTFHGYSANGNVTAPYVYVNYGSFWDFEDLLAKNVSLEGKIALAKYGGNFRGLKVKRAQELGMVGVVMYSDPQEDGAITESNGYKPYPEGPARNPSSVQRGSVQFLSKSMRKYAVIVLIVLKGSQPGDPTTPGWPSKPGVPRTDGNLSMPTIPSLPISYRDALPLLRALNGHGPNASEFSKFWQGGGLTHKGVNYNIGPTPKHIQLNLVNDQEYITTPIWNVIGVINGTLKDEVIILGNHRDAWIAGGAGDPNSGSAAMNEVIRSLGVAISRGWKPLRTIVFASWDGEEYGLLGSTEWCEEYLPWLSASTIAYLNVDTGAGGPNFGASASPLLNDLIYNITSLVPSPNQTIPGQTVLDTWTDRKIRTIGSGSDYTAFQDLIGIPSLDIRFGSNTPALDDDFKANYSVYHYHSNYDSFHWMDTYGDPTWEYHTTIAKIWALLAVKLSETPILPLSASTYAQNLEFYLSKLKETTKKSTISGKEFSFKALEIASRKFTVSATAFDVYTHSLTSELGDRVPWWKFWRKIRLWYKVKKANTQYKFLERQFLHPEGLDGDRSWFKHIVFAPGRWTGYAGATFPGLVESFEDGDLQNARKWEEIILSSLKAATKFLGGDAD